MLDSEISDGVRFRVFRGIRVVSMGENRAMHSLEGFRCCSDSSRLDTSLLSLPAARDSTNLPAIDNGVSL